MPIAAVPSYLGKDFKDASPGLRFGMYLKLWGVNRRTKALVWGTHDIDYEVRGQDRREREVKYENKVSALADAKGLNDTDKKTMQALLARQERAFELAVSADKLRLSACAVAPFTTGLGNEHPLENGFAFLNPYGLPYLPGSGVKGVLRQAARELANGQWGDQQGWSEERHYQINVGTARKPRWLGLTMHDVLFGRETASGDKDHLRGALSFWDVIPQIAGDHLLVEIMTPHQSHYYQQKPAAGSTNPHDSGQPTPISFLTVPPGSQFTFHVVCDAAHLQRLTDKDNKRPGAPDLLAEGETHWKTLLAAAFQHAFTWLGFGAKTAVGYGAMEPAHDRNCADANLTGQSQTVGTDALATAADRRAPQAPRVTSQEEVWNSAIITQNKGGGGIVTAQAERNKAEARGPAALAFLDSLSAEQRRRLEKKGRLEGMAVVVKVEGNLRTLVRLASLNNKGDAE
jgi:CRISPR-associated protein Cmr6